MQERIADIETIDRVVRVEGGFRMGPFELMDLVGVDTGFEISKSFYEQSFYEPRWQPSPITARYVAAGLRAQDGRGYYDYSRDPYRPPDPDRDPSPDPPGGEADVTPTAGGVLERIVCQVINECAFALGEGVGSAEDIDTGMVLGLNYPRDRSRGPMRSGSTTCWPCWMACGRSTARSATGRPRSCGAWCAPAGWDARPARASSSLAMRRPDV